MPRTFVKTWEGEKGEKEDKEEGGRKWWSAVYVGCGVGVWVWDIFWLSSNSIGATDHVTGVDCVGKEEGVHRLCTCV